MKRSDISSYAHFNLGTYNQTAGTGISNLGNTSLSANDAYIVTNNVIGHVTVGSLTLGTNYANLTGTVAGLYGQAAINQSTLLNQISTGRS